MKRARDDDGESTTTTAFFVDYPALVYQLFAPYLDLGARSRLAQTQSTLYALFYTHDHALSLMRSVWRIPSLTRATRIGIVKRSGNLQCLQWLWQGCDRSVNGVDAATRARLFNANVMNGWVGPAIESTRVEAIQWAAAQLDYVEGGEWDICMEQAFAMMLAYPEFSKDTLLDVITNRNGAWWNPIVYAEWGQRTQNFVPFLERMYLARRADLAYALLHPPNWPIAMSSVSRYGTSLIAAIRSEDISLFAWWWTSPECAALIEALPLDGDIPSHKGILAGVLGLMFDSPTQANVVAAVRMAGPLREYFE